MAKRLLYNTQHYIQLISIMMRKTIPFVAVQMAAAFNLLADELDNLLNARIFLAAISAILLLRIYTYVCLLGMDTDGA